MVGRFTSFRVMFTLFLKPWLMSFRLLSCVAGVPAAFTARTRNPRHTPSPQNPTWRVTGAAVGDGPIVSVMVIVPVSLRTLAVGLNRTGSLPPEFGANRDAGDVAGGPENAVE